MSYATPGDMKARYDNKRLGELVRDDGSRATPAELESDPNLQAALDDATGIIDAALLVGLRYTVQDMLDLLALNPPNSSTKLLIRLTCDLTYGLLLQRRGYTEAEMTNMAPGFLRAMKLVDRLAHGDLIFIVTRNLAAQGPIRTQLSKSVTLTSAAARHFGVLLDPTQRGV